MIPGNKGYFLQTFKIIALIYYILYEFGRAIITKHHRLRALNNRNVFSHNSGG